jgi:hypothetical protein
MGDGLVKMHTVIPMKPRAIWISDANTAGRVMLAVLFFAFAPASAAA